MTLLNIGLRRYTPSRARTGASRTVLGACPLGWGRPNAVWRHRQPPSIISDHVDHVQASNSLISQLPSRSAVRSASRPRRRIPPLLPPHAPAAPFLPVMPSSTTALAWPVIHHDIAFSSLEPLIDARPQNAPNLIYEPHSAMLDALMGVAGSPCDGDAFIRQPAKRETPLGIRRS